MKPTAFIVNVARGGLIDEDALYEALTAGVIAGAGLDVFVSEPPTDKKLLPLPNVVVTPHLGASTDEAQEKAGVSVARSVRLALEGELVPDAVNVAGGIIDPFVRPGIALVEKLGQVLAAVAGHGALTDLEVDVRGELAAYDVSVYRLAALKGYFTNQVTENVSYVNAPLLAEQRGITSSLNVSEESKDYRNTTTLRGVLSDGTSVEVAGTLAGTKMTEKLIGLNGYDIEVPIDRTPAVAGGELPGDRGSVGQAAVDGEPGGEPQHDHVGRVSGLGGAGCDGPSGSAPETSEAGAVSVAAGSCPDAEEEVQPAADRRPVAGVVPG